MSYHVKKRVLRIFETYHRPEFIGIDPLTAVRVFADPADREFGGLIASMLSYGRVETIIRNVRNIFARINNAPARFVLGTTLAEKRRTLLGFKHRFNDGDDIAVLLHGIAAICRQDGSMEPFIFEALAQSQTGMRGALERLSDTARKHAAETSGNLTAGSSFLLPSPAAGSACKRLNMFMRWMARPDDGIDLGVWRSIPPSALIMPVDTHISRICRKEGMTMRKGADWQMAEEITAYLRLIDPDDPVRFDFSLCRAGMVNLRKETA